MSVELRGIKTTLGGTFPYFKVNYTLDEMKRITDNAGVGLGKAVYLFDNVAHVVGLIEGPLLGDIRHIWREVCNGSNPGAYLGNKAGEHHFVRKDGTSDKYYLRVSPGQIKYEEDASGYTTLIQTGRIDDNVYGSWTGGNASGANIPIGISPVPNENSKVNSFDGPATNGQGLYSYILTSDGKFVRPSFFISFNNFGWQHLHLQEFEDPPVGSGFNPEDLYKTEHIKTISDSEDEGEVDVMARYNPRLGTSTVGAYRMNKEEVRAFLTDLWETNVIESIRSQFIGDGSNAILGLQWFYGLGDKITTYPTRSKVTVGNVAFDSTPAMGVIKTEFVEFDFGALAVPRKHGDYLDYTAVSYRAYLPFIGTIELDPRDIVGKTLYLKYYINITDGSAVCQLSSDSASPDTNGLLFSSSCQWGYDIPIRVDPGRGAALATLRTITGGMLFEGNTPSYTAGSLTPNTSVAGDFEPKLVLYDREEVSDASATKAAIGKPSGETFNVGEASGYLKAQVVYNGSSLPTRHAGEIIQLLTEGVYL